MSGLHKTLAKLTKRFDQLGVSYVVVGGMALTAHGYARMTEDIDVLVSRADLHEVHEHLVGRGYVRLFAGSKNIRDAETRVKIEFLIAGQFPGSGKPQGVSFPDPSDIDTVERDGTKFIGLAQLVELKLASGMTGGVDRARDLVDVQQLTKILRLPREFSAQLHPQVRARYQELWDALHATTKRYVRPWRGAPLTPDARTIDDLIEALGDAADELRRMKADGVTFEPRRDGQARRAYLVTADAAVAERYDMHEESEFFELEDADTPDGE